MVAIGERLPEMHLEDLAGGRHALASPDGRVKVIILWSAECPVVRLAEARLSEMRRGWPRDVHMLFLAPNADESRRVLEAEAHTRGIEPVLVDEKGRVAALLGATTTPYAVVVDGEGRLRYRGAVDDSTMRRREPSRHYLADAVEAVLAGSSPDPTETAGYGCAIVLAFDAS